jgi:hypothetical protein
MALQEDDEERGGPAFDPQKKEQIHKGSINEAIRKQSRQEIVSTTKYNLFIDYDSCEAYQGVHK